MSETMDPALRAVQQLDESLKDAFEAIEEDAVKDRKRLDTIEARQKAIGAEFERSRWERRLSVGISNYDFAALQSINDPAVFELAGLFENMGPSPRDKGRMRSPIFRAAAAEWLLLSLRVQRERGIDHASVERYLKLTKALNDIHSAAALVTTSTDLGGHWLPDPVAQEMYRLMLDNSVISPLATHVPMRAKTIDLPTEGSSALTVSWGTENTNITDSVPASNATNKVTLTAARLNGYAESSLEEIQDSAVSVLDWVQSKLTEQAGREIDRVLLEGSASVAPNVAGLLSASGVNAVSTGANGDAVAYSTLAAMPFLAGERGTRRDARWFLAPAMMSKIIGLVDSQGQPIVTFGRVPEGVAPQLLGYPAEVHSVIKADRTYGTGTTLSTLYFGPPSQFVIGDRMGMSWDVSDLPKFQAATVCMRLITRVGLGIAVPAAFSRHENLDV